MMNLNLDRLSESCGADWRGSVECPICGHLDNVDGLVTICGWCPSARALTVEAKYQGLEVSHGICAVHLVAFENGAQS